MPKRGGPRNRNWKVENDHFGKVLKFDTSDVIYTFFSIGMVLMIGNITHCLLEISQLPFVI